MVLELQSWSNSKVTSLLEVAEAWEHFQVVLEFLTCTISEWLELIDSRVLGFLEVVEP